MRPHIAHFLSHAPDPGGTTTTIQGLSLGLAKLGHPVTIYCCGATPTGRFRRELIDCPGVRIVHRHSARRNPFHVPEEILRRIERNQDGIDLLLVHGLFNPKNVTVAEAALRSGTPYVACPTSLYHPEMFRKSRLRKAVFGRLYERRFLRKACAIQAFSELQRELLRVYGVDRPMFCVPNGYDPGEAEAHQSDDAAVWRGIAVRILYLGRIDMHTKGLDLLLTALSSGVERGALPRSIQLTLIGPDSGDEERLKRLAARLGIQSNVRFLGRVDDQTRWSVIRSCSIMILPSRHDAFPTTVIEALASSKPVIVSDQTGISGLIAAKRCGYVVRAERDAICEGLARALETRTEWPAMGARGREVVSRELNWDVIARSASDLYRKLWAEITAASANHAEVA